jgi:uncharacterized membrane protein YphA (DoxX/SURF4 family)
MEAGLLLIRVVLGGIMAAHGAQKLFGWFGGHGLAGTRGWLDTMGFTPARLHALSSGSPSSEAARSSFSACSPRSVRPRLPA